MARHFGVKPPSVSGWITTGRIDKHRLNELFDYFSDTVPPSHWGLTGRAADLYLQREAGEILEFEAKYPRIAVNVQEELRELREDPDAYYAKQVDIADYLTKKELLGLIDKLDRSDINVLREMARRMFNAREGK